MITMPGLQIMEDEARRCLGRPDDAWIGQYHLGSEDAIALIELARCELRRRNQAARKRLAQAEFEVP